MRADLHLHSNYSDGSDSVVELAKKVHENGLNIIALSDHDTTDGLKPVKEVLSPDIKFIPAVELTCKAEDIKFHLLGYNINSESSALKDLIIKGKKLRRQKTDARVKYLKEVWGIELTKEELDWLYSRTTVVKTHFANILVKRGLANDNLSAMRKYLDGCKTGNTRFNGVEAISVIKQSGGIPVWAHPLGGEGETHFTEEEFIPKLNKMITYGIQGLECYYSRYTFPEIDFLIETANKYNLLISGGSDYHGTNKDVPIGRLNCEDKIISADKLTVLNEIPDKQSI